MNTKITATWTIELNCDCPKCGEYVNLLDSADFWEGYDLDIGEHDTKRSKGVEVSCPKCEHRFEVDFEY